MTAGRANGATRLDGFEWPRSILLGVPLLVSALAAVALVDLGIQGRAGLDPGAAILVVLATAPWATATLGWPARAPGRFGATVLAPLALLNVGGEWLGLVDLSSSGPQLSLMLVVFVVGQTATLGPPRVIISVTSAAVAVVLGRSLISGDVGDFAAWSLGLALPLAFGIAARAVIAGNLEARSAQEALAQEALGEERRRIAHEVHDVVAHTLAVTMLHLSAARLAVRSSPDRAIEALEEAERLGRASLADIRQVVRLLRAEPGSPTERSQPEADDLPNLVASYRAAGLAVDLRVEGVLTNASPATRLAVYRVVQESLTNAAKHGDGAARVVLAVEDNEAAVVIDNRCRSLTRSLEPGSGIIGMMERVGALGGHLDAGPVDMGWVVTARVPLYGGSP